MDAETAARRWADTWSCAWPQRDAEAIAALYADTAVYRSPAFRQPYSGPGGVGAMTARTTVEENIARWFGEPIVEGDRAAVNGGAAGESRGRNSPSPG